MSTYKVVVVICVTAIVITILGIGGWVIAAGYSAERGLGWIGTNIGPVVLLLVNLLVTKTVKDDTRVVRHRTNGVLDQLFGRVRTLEQRAGVAPPAPDAAPDVTRDPRGGPASGPG